jgi:hypothetical protein
MGDHDFPPTCLSSKEHGSDVRDVLLHYFGCLRETERERYLASLPVHKQERIKNEETRIKKQRALFENQDHTKDLVRRLRNSLSHYFGRARPHEAGQPFTKLLKENAWGMNAYAVFFRNSEPYTDPKCLDKFPNQKLAIKDLLYLKDETKNPLMRPCEDNEIRYFHLPGNNMEWIEVSLHTFSILGSDVSESFAGSYCTSL